MGLAKNIFIPIEVPQRDWYPKALLALHLAEKGYRVLIGPDYLLKDLSLVPGIFIGKNHIHFSTISRGNRCFKFLYLDDENAPVAAGHKEIKKSVEARLWSGLRETVDWFTCWGDYQATLFKQLTPKPITVTGHPNFEAAKKQYSQLAKIHDQTIVTGLDGYILVNTRFAIVNAGVHLSAIDDNSEFFASELEVSVFRNLLSSELVDLGHTLRLVESLSLNFPYLTVVVRPHPAEQDGLYRTLFRDLRNVQIEKRGHVIPWLRHALVVVSGACMTSIQTTFSGVPLIEYSPERFAEDSDPAYQSHEQVNSINEVILAVREIHEKRRKAKVPVEEEGKSEYLDSLFGASKSTFNEIAEVLEKLSADVCFEPHILKKTIPNKQYLSRVVREAMKRLNGERFQGLHEDESRCLLRFTEPFREKIAFSRLPFVGPVFILEPRNNRS